MPPPTPEERIPIRDDVSRLFRAEAVEHYQRGRADEGHLLEIEPRWTRYAYRLVLALLAATVLFGVWWVRRG